MFTKSAKKVLLFIFVSLIFSSIYYLLHVDEIELRKRTKKNSKILFEKVKKVQKIKESSSISINKASLSKLILLPGIGKKTAQKIITFREKHPFKSVEEIMKVKGIGIKKFQKIKVFITL